MAIKVEDITVGTVGGKDWGYFDTFPLGNPGGNQIQRGVLQCMPVSRWADSFETTDAWESYLYTEFIKYESDAGILWELKESLPLVSITAGPKTAVMRYDGVGGYSFWPVCYYNGEIIEVNYENFPSLYTLSGGFNNLAGRVAIVDGDPNKAHLLNTSFNWWYDNNMAGWLYNLPYFDSQEDLEAYLMSENPDWKDFNGVGGEAVTPVDPGGGDQRSEDITGTWENLGIDTSTGPVRVATISQSELNHLAEALKAGWLAGNIGEGIISIKYVRTPMTILASEHEMGIIDTKGIVTDQIKGKFVSHQFQSYTLGKIKIGEKFGDFTDYTNARIELYLPFIGNQNLDVKSIINNDCTLVAGFDFITGSVIYQLEVVQVNGIKQVLYYWSGNCSMELPLSSIDYGQKVTQFLAGVMQIGVSAATGMYPGIASGAATIASGSISDSHVQIGNLSSNYGWGNIMFPYFSIYYSKIPSVDYKPVSGLPCHKMLKLGNLTGYTEVSDIHLDGITALEAEKQDLLSRLKSGVIL